MREAVIVSYARTGLAKSGRGGFNITPPMSMAAHAIKHAVDVMKRERQRVAERNGDLDVVDLIALIAQREKGSPHAPVAGGELTVDDERLAAMTHRHVVRESHVPLETTSGGGAHPMPHFPREEAEPARFAAEPCAQPANRQPLP